MTHLGVGICHISGVGGLSLRAGSRLGQVFGRHERTSSPGETVLSASQAVHSYVYFLFFYRTASHTYMARQDGARRADPRRRTPLRA